MRKIRLLALVLIPFCLLSPFVFGDSSETIVRENMETLWQFAQREVGISSTYHPPKILIQEIEPSFYDGRFEEEKYAVLIAPRIFSSPIKGYWEYVLTHELIHAALHKKGLPIFHHHDWMAENQTPFKSAKFILEKFYPFDFSLLSSRAIKEEAEMLRMKTGFVFLQDGK